MLIVCLKHGKKYDSSYVNTLYDSVIRNLAEGTQGRFWCFTDDADGLNPDIEAKSLPSDLHGWWGKLWLFSSEAIPAGERVFYFDLDTAICGPLDEIVRYNGEFAILRDFYRPDGWQSSVMSWVSGTMDYVWTSWHEAHRPNVIGGDQAWIEKAVKQADLWQKHYPARFVSYKVHATRSIPKGASVVVFHGEPRPHQCSGWVPHVWKIGGGSAAELVQVWNLPEEDVIENIKAACALDLPWLDIAKAHEREAIIVGGGPSLADEISSLALNANYADVFATGNTARWCIENDIAVHAQIILDARKDNANFVADVGRHYVASQCHPGVFARSKSATVFHPLIDGIQELLPHNGKARALIGGGSTVGLKAIIIAFVLGYRRIHLYGFDSCYRDKSHHAYPQSMNDDEQLIDVTAFGRQFKCAPWMASQAQEFMDIVPRLKGAELVVHGEGLIPWIAEKMAEPASNDVVIIDGLMWPAQDIETRPSVMATQGDVYRALRYVKRHGLAIQAGGNVGVWALNLSREFDRVLTFEPEPLLLECLKHNVRDRDNITVFDNALSDKEKTLGTVRDVTNPGASFVSDGNTVKAITIDSLNLDACDFIQLDIEGYELHALRGAEKTLRAFSPVLMLELKELGNRYGSSDADVYAFLTSLGYTVAERVNRDVIFERKHNAYNRPN